MGKNKYLNWSMLVIFLWTIAFSINVPQSYASTKSTDITGHWAQSQIENLTAQNIISGYPDGTFKPDKTITRAEFVTVLVKAFKLEAINGKVFNDTANHWAKDYIATVNASGIVNGYSNDRFGPDDEISREQMAVMIVKSVGLETIAAGKVFSDDSEISAWAKNAVNTATGNNLISGYPDNTFKPQGSANRAEAAIVVNKAIEIIVQPQTQPQIHVNTFDKAGTYGPATGTETIIGAVTIKASGVILKNTTITGDLTIAEAVANGDVELNNVKVEGTAYINGGGENSIAVNQCELNKVVVNKKDGKIRIVLSKDSSIKTLVADSGLKLVGQGKITDLTINNSGVEIEPKPVNKPSIKSGVSARVGGETLSGTTSSGGGGAVITANVSNAAQLTTALANANITTITLASSFTASPTINRSLTMNFGAYTLMGDVSFSHALTGTSVLIGDTGNRITGNLTVNTANASFNNGVAVSGTVTVVNVAPASWTESAAGNTLTITDPDGATITITGSPGSVTVSEGAGGNLTLTVSAGATITSITSNAPVNIVVAAGAAVTNITAAAGSGGSTITNNGTISGTLTVNAAINLVANVAPATTTIGASGSAVITGTDAGSVPVENVSAITVTAAGNATTVVNGGTLQMSAAATPTNATNKTVTWSVTNGTGSATISLTGLLTATGAGTVTLKATAQDGSGVFGEKVITVQAVQTGEAVLLSKLSGAGMPTSQIRVQINGSFIDTYTLYFDGAPLASTSNGIVTIATAVLNDLSRVQILYNTSNYTSTNGGSWQ